MHSSGSIAPEFAEVERFARQRQEARLARNWDGADSLREESLDKGWEVQDTASGYEL